MRKRPAVKPWAGLPPSPRLRRDRFSPGSRSHNHHRTGTIRRTSSRSPASHSGSGSRSCTTSLHRCCSRSRSPSSSTSDAPWMRPTSMPAFTPITQRARLHYSSPMRRSGGSLVCSRSPMHGSTAPHVESPTAGACVHPEQSLEPARSSMGKNAAVGAQYGDVLQPPLATFDMRATADAPEPWRRRAATDRGTAADGHRWPP